MPSHKYVSLNLPCAFSIDPLNWQLLSAEEESLLWSFTRVQLAKLLWRNKVEVLSSRQQVTNPYRWDTVHELNWTGNNNVNDRMQISGTHSYSQSYTRSHKVLLVSVHPARHSATKKNKVRGNGGASGREGAPGGKGENGSACSFCFPLFHRGAPIDRSSAQIRQQMLELTVSFNRGRKAQQATSRALDFISSSLHPSAF